MPNYIKADQFSTHTEFVVAVMNLWMASLVNMNRFLKGAEVIDYTGYSIAPGLVDTHSWIWRCGCHGQ